MSCGRGVGPTPNTPPLLPYRKSGVIFNRCFCFIHSSHLGPSRPLPQQSCEIGELGGRSRGVDLNGPVIQVAHPPADTERLRRVLHKIAESDALHAASYPIQFGEFLFAQSFRPRLPLKVSWTADTPQFGGTPPGRDCLAAGSVRARPRWYPVQCWSAHRCFAG
jgi:hypothetical protein